jgi:hypothetical protein
MKALRLTAASIALIGFGSSLADETLDNSATPADGASAPSRVLWSEYDPAESTLLKQANAVYAALRAREAVEQGIEIDTVLVTAADAGQGNTGTGNCRHLAEPGSLFMRERCFYETRGEESLNEFQYRMEKQFIRDQQDRNFLESAEYELAYRQYLNQQQQ